MNKSLRRGLLVAILLLAFGLRVYGLGAQELRGDEAFGFFFQQRDYGQIIADTIALDEPHPVASYFLQKPWLLAAGTSEFALRFGGVWFSVLAVALLTRLGQRLALRPHTTVLGAFLLALSPYAVWHSQDARMYSMSMALNTAAIWLAVEALARRRWQWIAAYLATALLALHTHYFSGFVLLGLTLFVVGRAIFVPSARMALRDWFLWNVLLAAAYAPWLTLAGGILAGYGGNGDSPGFGAMVRRVFSVFAVGESTPTAQQIGWALLAAALLLLAALRLWMAGPGGRRALWLLACSFGAPVLLTWYGALERPIFNERYLIAAAPAFALLLAAALESPRSLRARLDWAAGALLLTLVIGMGLGLNRYYHDPAWSKSRGWRDLAATMLRYGSGLPPEQVYYAQNYPDPTLWYYTGDVPHGVLPPQANDEAATRAEMESLTGRGIAEIVLAEQPSPTWDPNRLAHRMLAEGFQPLTQSTVGNFTATPHLRMSLPTPPLHVEFERSVRLCGADVQPQQPVAGGFLIVGLCWETVPEESGPTTPNVSVQVLGPDGNVVAQADKTLQATLPRPEPTASDGYGILLPEALPPGDYRLIVAVYDPLLDGLPRLTTSDGSDHVEIARWTLP